MSVPVAKTALDVEVFRDGDGLLALVCGEEFRIAPSTRSSVMGQIQSKYGAAAVVRVRDLILEIEG